MITKTKTWIHYLKTISENTKRNYFSWIKPNYKQSLYNFFPTIYYQQTEIFTHLKITECITCSKLK